MRRKKERSKQGQTNKAKQHSTPKAVTFPRKYELPGGTRTHDTLYSRQSALPAELPRQHSWLGPNLTSHSTCTCTCTWPSYIGSSCKSLADLGVSPSICLAVPFVYIHLYALPLIQVRPFMLTQAYKYCTCTCIQCTCTCTCRYTHQCTCIMCMDTLVSLYM